MKAISAVGSSRRVSEVGSELDTKLCMCRETKNKWVLGTWSLMALTLAICGQTTSLRADPNTLAPGGTLYPISAGPGLGAGATLLYTTNSAWSNWSINGTLISSVYQNDPNNPYGGLTFTYQVILNGSSVNGLGQLTVSSYENVFPIDVTYDSTSSSGETVPFFATRSSSSVDGGSDLNFTFVPEMTPGSESVVLDVDTGSQTWFPGIASVIDHLSVPNLATLGPAFIPPIPVPEPSTMTLAAVGGLGALAYLRRKIGRKP